MKRAQRLIPFALLGIVVVAATACTTSGGSDATPDRKPTTTTSQPGSDTDPDQVVWQEFTGGGYIPAEYAAGEVPQVTIYADGRILIDVTDPQGVSGGPVLLQQAQVSPADLADFLADADASGLFDPGTDFGSPGVTDQPSTTVTLRAGGPPEQVDVYALDFEFDDDMPGQITADQSIRRAELKDLLAQARALGKDGKAYVPDRVKAVLFDPEASVDLPDSGMAWPGPPFSAFPPFTDGSVQSCLVIEGDDAASVYAADQENTDTTWVLDSEVRRIVIAPLVPGQEGCPPS